MTNIDLNKARAIRHIGALVPTGGEGTPICPATYADSEKFAVSRNQPVMVFKDGKWTPSKDEDGKIILRDSVLVSSNAAQAHRISEAIVENVDLIGDEEFLPGIFLNTPSDERIMDVCSKVNVAGSPHTVETLAAQLKRDIESAQISTWTTSHRHVDSLIRHAEVDGKQIWADLQSETAKIINGAYGDGGGENLVRYFPNSAIFGFWLSSAAPRLHKWARALSSEIIGYDAHAMNRGTTKMDALGGFSSTLKMKRNPSGELVSAGSEKDKPSTVGLGMVPSKITEQAFTCSTILHVATISLAHIKNIKSSTGGKKVPQEVVNMLAWLSIYGILASEVMEYGFIRSGTDLVQDASRSYWEVVKGDGTTENFEITLEEAAEEFKNAYAALPSEWKFAERIDADYSDVILRARAETIIVDSKTKDKGEDN